MSTGLSPAAHIGAEPTDTAPIDEGLLSRVLEPYSYKGCRYLIDATYRATADTVLAYGNFTIAESAYIRSTGHFNAAELILCFNQLAYCAFAPAVRDEQIAALRGWSITDYLDNQLSSMLIKTTSSRFCKPINAQRFSARLACRDFRVIERTLRYLLIPCAIEFWDEHGGSASGQVELAVLNIP